tara:strand:+ start:22788 stop:24761 length:1974 start_codon:yes stop_codon:yes gene_type:complete
MTSFSPKQISNAATSIRIALDVMRRPAPVALADWADANFYMSAESSYAEGPWRTLPFQRVPLNLMGNEQVEEFDFIKSARVGYSKMIMASVAYQVEHKKRNQIIYQPTDAAASSFMKEHVQPMIRDVPAVRGLASWFGKKHPNNTLDSKTFDNRRKLWVMGGTSAKNYREKSVDTVYMDELDGFDEDVEGEGRPDHLAGKRNEGSYFKKLICGSTPTEDHKSLIGSRSASAECLLRCHIPCPHCSHPQHLVFDHMRMLEPGNPHSTEYACESCGAFFSYQQSQEAQVDCFYRDPKTGITTQDGLTFTDIDGEPVETPRHVALHVWSAYSPMTDWAKIMRDFLARKKDPSQLKTWVNQTRGETWKEKGDAPEWERLYERTRGTALQPNKLEDWVALVTMGVDVQRSPGRLELEIVGWGPGRRTQSIDYRVFSGDTSDLGPSGPWEQLRQIIRSETWEHSSGVHLPVACTAVDSGDQTQTVYTFCREFQQPQVIPIKGEPNLTTIVGIPKPVDVSQAGRKLRRGVMLWGVGINLLKTELYSWLKLQRPTDESGEDLPAGWCEFPEYGEDYFKGLCSEQMARKKNRAGYTVWAWEKIYERNEPLDCRVYARAAAAVKGVDRWTDRDWLEIRQSLGIVRRQEKTETEARNGVTFKKSTFWD